MFHSRFANATQISRREYDNTRWKPWGVTHEYFTNGLLWKLKYMGVLVTVPNRIPILMHYKKMGVKPTKD